MKEKKPDSIVDSFSPEDSNGIQISSTGTIQVVCGAQEHLGNVRITGTSEPVAPDYIQVCLYSGGFPSNPNSEYLDYFYIDNKGGGKGPTSKQTNRAWGSGYYVAASCKDQNGKWKYICKAGPT